MIAGIKMPHSGDYFTCIFKPLFIIHFHAAADTGEKNKPEKN